ncbi:hypothetical protein BDN70DRAFT_890304 [Pholiota conissans]|uniref:Uncharacterized protein n=1 Tax=Pholiota conissans TaxID=109636 RepID=A0A9P5ZCF3_9AGAR|nr:hypothetical protein BDN70DRAFT_890304 [Pholiota conissans]
MNLKIISNWICIFILGLFCPVDAGDDNDDDDGMAWHVSDNQGGLRFWVLGSGLSILQSIKYYHCAAILPIFDPEENTATIRPTGCHSGAAGIVGGRGGYIAITHEIVYGPEGQIGFKINETGLFWLVQSITIALLLYYDAMSRGKESRQTGRQSENVAFDIRMD